MKIYVTLSQTPTWRSIPQPTIDVVKSAVDKFPFRSSLLELHAAGIGRKLDEIS